MAGAELITPVLLAIIGCALLALFFWYYGAFKFPATTSVSLLITIYIAIFQTFALLPYDITLTLFGSSGNDAHGLGITLEVTYWISWCLGWIITPVLATIYSYNYGMTFGTRLWYAIRYNIWWYVYAGIAVAVGVIILLATKMFTFAALFPLVISLSNAYGLLLICLLFGYGFFGLPKYLWLTADRKKRLEKHLFDINKEADDVIQTIVNCRALRDYASQGRDQVIIQYRELFQKNIDQRIHEIDELLVKTPITNTRYFQGVELSKDVKKVLELRWRSSAKNELEEYLRITDNNIKKLTCSGKVLINSADSAQEILLKKDGEDTPSIELWGKRVLAVIVGILCLIAFWGEITIIFNNKLSLFYILSHIKCPGWVGELFITFPILLFQTLVAAWALSKIHLGNYFRFIKGGSSDTTFYYLVIILGRVAPTVGYHYLMQIGGDQSQTMKVFYKSSEVFILGDYWPIFSPVLMALIGLCVLFNVYNRILKLCRCANYAYDDEDASNENMTKIDHGKAILADLRPELDNVIGDVERKLNLETPLAEGW